jgi:hypothetical protein
MKIVPDIDSDQPTRIPARRLQSLETKGSGLGQTPQIRGGCGYASCTGRRLRQ